MRLKHGRLDPQHDCEQSFVLERPDKPLIGLVAGWGDFPLAVARRLVAQGFDIACAGLHGHTHPQLKDYCREYRCFGLGQMGGIARFLARNGVQQLTMAGKIHKRLIFEKWAWLKHLPDWTFCRYFYPMFWRGNKNRNDDTLLLTVTRMFEDHGMKVAPATDFAPELLIPAGLLTKRQPTEPQWRDIDYGWHLAKEMGRLDVGQCVAVKGQAVLAIEAIEGTDECIRRAGQLCPAGGFVVVKVAKPNQDMRFDVPTIGVGTIKTMRDAGAKLLAVEAGQTIFLNAHETVALANQYGITLIATDAQELSSKVPRRDVA
jgi:hypothetical protein